MVVIMEYHRRPYNRLRLLMFGIFGASIFYLLNLQGVGFPGVRHFEGSDFGSRHPSQESPQLALKVSGNSYMPFEEATEFCSKRRYEPYPDRSRRRKIFDFTLLNTELDWLEIRLGEMYDNVDYFVIMESNKTFTNVPKPLIIKDNWQRFKPFHDKMIHATLNDSVLTAENSTWQREKFSRNAMFNQVLPYLEGDQAAALGDVLIVADVDEIPRPETLQTLRNCDFPPKLTLMSKMYYYSFQWQLRGDWDHPQATIYQGVDTVEPNTLRHRAGSHRLYNAAWHCSYCFSTLEELVLKVSSFSHSEYNKPKYKNRRAILNRIRNGLDFFDRNYTQLDYIQANPDVPGVLREDCKKWAFALDRDSVDANFRDYTPADSQYDASLELEMDDEEGQGEEQKEGQGEEQGEGQEAG